MAASPPPTPAAVDPRLIQDAPGIRGWLNGQLRRLKSGELGSLPVVLGLLLIWTIFQSLNDRFLSSENLSNLALQMAAVGTISVGIVLVLLLGEIDLSAGSVSGLCAAVLAVLSAKHGVNPLIAVMAAIAVGALIGLIQGSLFSRLSVPSFVVTLSGLIGWQGLQLFVLGTDGTINLPFDGALSGISNTFLPAPVGLALAVAVPVTYAASALRTAARRRARGLPVKRLASWLPRVVVLAGTLITAALVLNGDRGVPLTLLIFGFIVVSTDRLLVRTKFGRHVYAVGGNVEAARRAGINVVRIRTAMFVGSAGLAAVGGILAASRLSAVNQSSGGSDTLLNAIAAAVIGGTSLFGGRGRTYSAILGILVIASIANGMFLLSLDSSVRFMVTGLVLALAVTIDSVSRRGRKS